jgi:hypothetical protein
MATQRKIFGIGLSRTGTTSLHRALTLLGYRSIHCPRLDQVEQLIQEHDAAVDTPIACQFRELDARYPGSLFILTIRDYRQWLESTRWLFSGPPPVTKWKQELRLKTYGVLTWDRRTFLASYHRHLDSVLEYFEDRPEALLTLDITAGENWEKLCSFLGVPVPDVEFPFENARYIR